LVAEKPQRKQIASRREPEIGMSFRFDCFTKEQGAAGAILRSGRYRGAGWPLPTGRRAAKYHAASEEQRQ
jgi:hypothetical protein